MLLTDDRVQQQYSIIFHRDQAAGQPMPGPEGEQQQSTLSAADTERLAQELAGIVRSNISNKAAIDVINRLSESGKTRMGMAILAAMCAAKGSPVLSQYKFPEGNAGEFPADGELTIGHDPDLEMAAATLDGNEFFSDAVKAVTGHAGTTPTHLGAPLPGASQQSDVTAMMDRQAARTEDGLRKIKNLESIDPSDGDAALMNAANATTLRAQVEASKDLAGAELADKQRQQATAILKRSSDTNSDLAKLQKGIAIGGIMGCDSLAKHAKDLHAALLRGIADELRGDIGPFQGDELNKIIEETAEKFCRFDSSIWLRNATGVELCRGRTTPDGKTPVPVQSRAEIKAWVEKILRCMEMLGCEVSAEHGGYDCLDLIMRRVDFLFSSARVTDYGMIAQNYVKTLFEVCFSMLSDRRNGWLATGQKRFQIWQLLKHVTAEDVINDSLSYTDTETAAALHFLRKWESFKLLGQVAHVDQAALSATQEAMSRKMDAMNRKLEELESSPEKMRKLSDNTSSASPSASTTITLQQQPGPHTPYYQQAPQFPGPAHGFQGFQGPPQGFQAPPTQAPPPAPHFQSLPPPPPQPQPQPPQQLPRLEAERKRDDATKALPVLPPGMTKHNRNARSAWKSTFRTPLHRPAQCFYKAVSELSPRYKSWGRMCKPGCPYLHPGDHVDGTTIPAIDKAKLEKFLSVHSIPDECDMK